MKYQVPPAKGSYDLTDRNVTITDGRTAIDKFGNPVFVSVERDPAHRKRRGPAAALDGDTDWQEEVRQRRSDAAVPLDKIFRR